MINTEAADPCWEEFRKYAIRNSLTGYERRILWDWIRSGYGACGTAGRGCLSRPACPRADPTDTRGPGRWLAEDTKGMAGDAAGVCLKPYGVCEDSSPEQAVMNGARKTCPDLAGARSRRLERELFHLWEFVWQEGVGDEAREFVDERKSDEIPFEC